MNYNGIWVTTDFLIIGAVHGDVLVEVEPRKEIVLIDRPKFDGWMVRHYEQSGGKLIEGDGLVSVDFANGVARLSSGREISYRNMIAADGANGTVERLLKPARWDASRGNSLCLEVNVDRADCPDADGVQIHFGVVPHSYAWSFATVTRQGAIQKSIIHTGRERERKEYKVPSLFFLTSNEQFYISPYLRMQYKDIHKKPVI